MDNEILNVKNYFQRNSKQKDEKRERRIAYLHRSPQSKGKGKPIGERK